MNILKHLNKLYIIVISCITFLSAGLVLFIKNYIEIFEFIDTVEHHNPEIVIWVKASIIPILIGAIIILSLLLFFKSRTLERLLKEESVQDKIKIVLFLSPASHEDGGFYDKLLRHFLIEASVIAKSGLQMMIMPSVPHRTFSEDPELILENEIPKNVSGMFIIPGNPDVNVEKIKSLNTTKHPVILIDVNVGTVNQKDTTLPHFVGGDEVAGGKCAAELAIAACHKHKRENPVVQIITGRDTEWEKQRHIAFRDELKNKIPFCAFLDDSEPLHYDKDSAKKWMETKIRRLKSTNPNNQVKLDIIFACNDAMALGALEAIEEAKERSRGCDIFEKPPLIIGYDGTKEMIDLQKSGNPHLAGTVSVDIQGQATRGVAMMSMLLKGNKPLKKMDLVIPKPEFID
jgi:ABC-type sugar transport system substrate-binding protein